MNAIPKKKLCWNCEGNVSVAEENCPYCGVSVSTPALEGINNSFAPPYRIANNNKNQNIPASPYAAHNPSTDNSKDQEEKEEDSTPDVQSVQTDEFKSVLTPMLLLLSGSVFFLFGLALFLFSQNGVFTLSWNGNLWYVYLIFSAAFLFFGWRSMQHLKE